MSNQLQITGDLKVKSLTGALTATAGVVTSVPLGAANGVATLGSDGKVPSAQLPTMGSSYKGTWNAATNTPTIADGVGTAGDYYLVSTGGTWNGIVFLAGNTVIYSGTVWQKAGGGSGTVTSVGLAAPAAFSVSGSPVTSTGTLTLAGAGTTNDYIKGDGTLAVFNSAAISAVSGTYLALAGGTMTGQIVLKEGTTISDYTKGLRFPNDPYGGSGDTSGLRLYAETTTGAEAQVLELYITNDGAGVPQDRINFQAPSNDLVTINGNKIWNAGNLTPQTQLNGTGFVKASGTTISYDNSTYLTTSAASSTYLALSGGTLTGPLNGTSAAFLSTITSTNSGGTFLNATNTAGGFAKLEISGNATSVATLSFTNSLNLTGGNVGIGTSSPATTLDVRASIGSGQLITLANTSAFSNTNTLEIGFLLANANSGLVQAATIGTTNPAATGNNYGDIYFKTANTGSPIERMRITNGGNVGIGTDTPEALLHLNKAVQFGEGAYIFIDNSAGSALGNKSGIRFGNNTGASFSNYDSYIEAINVNAGNGAASLTFGTWDGASRGERMRVTSDGSLLIGTQTDLGSGYKLQVNGSISMAYANFFNFKGSSGAGDVLVDNSGSTLRVTGAVQLSNAVTFNSTALVQGLLTNYNVYNTQTSSYTLVLSDASKIIEMNVGSANTVTIPANASVAFPIGTEITVMQYGAGITSIAVASGVTIVSKDNANIIANRYTGVTLVKRATNEWYLIGNIVV